MSSEKDKSQFLVFDTCFSEHLMFDSSSNVFLISNSSKFLLHTKIIKKKNSLDKV